MAAVAFALGAIFGAAHHGSAAQALVSRFVGAWARSDYAAMYEEIDPASQQALSAERFAAAYRRVATTATATAMTVSGRVQSRAGGSFAVPVRMTTRLFGTLRERLALRIAHSGDGLRVQWSRALLFPGLRAGETLSRRTSLPPRAALLARDGSVLAQGQPEGAGQRDSPLGAAAAGVVGEVGPAPSAHRQELEAQGVPPDAIVGVSGLELTFDDRLRGSPGGELLGGARVLASAPAKAGTAVRTSISPVVQQAAAVALGAQYGGVVAMEPSTGEILAVAGIGLDALQPPGSTFKMITLSGVLEAKLATPASVFEYATAATLDGVRLENANGESCGGSLALAFAVSCNSVFAPLGVKLGAARLVSTAEAFGFNHDPGLPGAVQSTIPPASQIQGELALGSTAIGQGQVQASALEMATVAATIGDGGSRPAPTFAPQAAAHGSRAVSPAVARTVRRLMIGVVRSGTGTAAAIPEVVVAGKTGTAELGIAHCSANGESGHESSSGSQESASESKTSAEGCQAGVKDPRNTDAWFAAFAPALHPKIAVGVLLVKDGAGGETAAPVAREVLEAGLR